MINRYAGLFKYRVFKNQYSIEFLLPTGKRCRECERFARKIVNNMNDSSTRLIGMSPNDATKLERIYSEASVKYNRPIGVDESQLPKDDSEPQRPFVREQLMHIKEKPMLPPRWILEDNQIYI
ncbi:12816_t:CDS:2, partial [Acaulospora morrowiae]